MTTTSPSSLAVKSWNPEPQQSSLALAGEVASQHVARTTKSDRKARGQFFTPPPVAEFMAGLFEKLPENCRLLDAGAGVGTLTAAVFDRLLRTGHVSSVDVVAYEMDATAVLYLEKTLAQCQVNSAEHGATFSGEVRVADFIADVANAGRALFAEQATQFDLAIINPPYFKLRADSVHAALAKRIGPTQPNIYSLFMAAAIEWLRPGGELVAITPRSFCNGLYFRDFRNWILERTELLQIHTFRSRTETFREANVLQENIITHFRRRTTSGQRKSRIVVSRSIGRDFDSVTRDEMGRSRVIDDTCGDNLICVPESREDAGVVELTEGWPGRFSDTGLRISTGPVVMFRTRPFHAESATEQTVPLLTSHHVRIGTVVWPREKKKWPSSFLAVRESEKHLVPTQNYVLLKRFSAKEERRRLSSGVLRSEEFDTPTLAIENHVNYILHQDRELRLEEAVGVTAVLNSAVMDRYFRTFSGNTQVNATEIRMMKFPCLATISQIGQRILAGGSANSESIVMDELGVCGDVRGYLKGFVK